MQQTSHWQRSWTELQATWNKAATGTNWQSAGARGRWTAHSTVLGTVTATATGIRNVVLNAAGLAVVQGWVNNPATNFGFILQDYANSTKDDLVFSSKEATVAANRPQLQVLYNPPSLAPLSLSSLEGTASVAGTSDEVFAAKLVQTSTGGQDTSVAKLAQPFALEVTASQPSNLLLAAVPSRRLSSKAADAALTDLGDDHSAGRDILLDDELLLDTRVRAVAVAGVLDSRAQVRDRWQFRLSVAWRTPSELARKQAPARPVAASSRSVQSQSPQAHGSVPFSSRQLARA